MNMCMNTAIQVIIIACLNIYECQRIFMYKYVNEYNAVIMNTCDYVCEQDCERVGIYIFEFKVNFYI